jgi:hypothetical protein
MGLTTTRFRRRSPRRWKGAKIGGGATGASRVPALGLGASGGACRSQASSKNQRSTRATSAGSRRRRFSQVMRLLRVMRLKVNCSGSCPT